MSTAKPGPSRKHSFLSNPLLWSSVILLGVISFFISFDFRHPLGVSGVLDVVTDGGTLGHLARWVGEGPPTTPTLTVAQQCAPVGVILSWTGPNPFTDYHVERCHLATCTNDDFSLFAQETDLSYTDTNVSDHNTYTYRVYAHDHNTSLSTLSNEARISIACLAPPVNAAKFISQLVPSTMQAGTATTTSVTMKNCRPGSDCGNLKMWRDTRWQRLTTSARLDVRGSGLTPDFHVLSESSILALGEGGIYYWDGIRWKLAIASPEEPAVAGHSPLAKFQYYSPTEIYALGWLSGKIWRWDGTAWKEVACCVQNDFYALANDNLYGIRHTTDQGYQVWHWNGSVWDYPVTTQTRWRFAFVSPTTFYSPRDNDDKVWKWTIDSKGAITGTSLPSSGLGQSISIWHFVSENEIYVWGWNIVRGTLFLRWNGSIWEELPLLQSTSDNSATGYGVSKVELFDIGAGLAPFALDLDYIFKFVANPPDTTYYLGSAFGDTDTTWGIGKTVIPYAISPGQYATTTFTITAPTEAGTYNFQWCMREKGVETFQQCSPLTNITVFAFIDIGLRVYDGTATVAIAAEPGAPTSPLRIHKAGTTYGIVLVDPSDLNATKVRINTAAGVKALRKYP